jgi:hypothetical protein
MKPKKKIVQDKTVDVVKDDKNVKDKKNHLKELTELAKILKEEKE